MLCGQEAVGTGIDGETSVIMGYHVNLSKANPSIFSRHFLLDELRILRGTRCQFLAIFIFGLGWILINLSVDLIFINLFDIF